MRKASDVFVSIALAVGLSVAMSACDGSQSPSAPSEPDDPIVIPVIAKNTFTVTAIDPPGGRVVSMPFYASIRGVAYLDPRMLPAWAGIVYVEDDGSNGITHWSTMGLESDRAALWTKPRDFHQEFRARDGEYCTSYQLCRDYLPGKVINAVFIVGRKDLGADGYAEPPWRWDGTHTIVDWSKVVYRQDIPIGYRFR